MNDHDIEPNQTWIVDRFRPEDAVGVTRLFLSVYGDKYPIRKFIDPDLLIKENETNQTISSVARTPGGDVIGHNAIFHSAPSEKIFESGSGLVHRHYRGGQGIFTDMGVHGIKIADEEFKAAAIWGEFVCNRVFAQKAGRRVGWETCALEVDLMPAAMYSKEKSASGRVSTMMMFGELNPRRHQVFLPRVYEEWLKELYTKLTAPRDYASSTSAPRAGVSSDLKTQIFDFAQVARLIIHRVGDDFDAVFARNQEDALKRKVVVFQAWLPLSDPATNWAVDRLREQGYFFGGLLPRWFDDDGILMQKILDPPSWESIAIGYDWSGKVFNMVKADWEAVKDALR